MSAYRISELAERTGFPASTLRYYEHEGLLPAPARTSGGYRSYGDEAVERLKLVARAKRLGLPLAEIRELADVWDAGSCGSVQELLGERLVAKLGDIDARLASLSALRGQLRTAAAQLHQHPADGPCDDECGCLAAPSEPVAAITCTLSADDQAVRAAQWRDLVAGAARQERLVDGVRLALPADASTVARAARLAVLEQQCCSFFSFTLDVGTDEVTLAVRAPAAAAEIVDAMFTQQAGSGPRC